MRILHLAPLWFPVCTDAVGGIESFLAGLIAALERSGCRNRLVASGDSRTAAELVPAVPSSLYAPMTAGTAWEYEYYEQHQLMVALEQARDVDLVHSHAGRGAYALSAVPNDAWRVLHTHHTPVTPDLEWFVVRHPGVWFSTVSECQAHRLRARGAARCEAIHNGVDMAAFTFQPRAGDGLLFIGRMEWVKGPDRAVQVARALGRPLTLAGPVIDETYFARSIAPCLDDQIRYVGMVGHRRKDELLGQAACLLVPSRQEEGFSMVSVEAMATGTPVVALDNGALPEVVEPGVTGYLTSDEESMAELATGAAMLDRAAVRARAAARFDVAVVAERYHELYTRILDGPQ